MKKRILTEITPITKIYDEKIVKTKLSKVAAILPAVIEYRMYPTGTLLGEKLSVIFDTPESYQQTLSNEQFLLLIYEYSSNIGITYDHVHDLQSSAYPQTIRYGHRSKKTSVFYVLIKEMASHFQQRTVRAGCGSNPNNAGEILSVRNDHNRGDLSELVALVGHGASGRGSSRQTAHGVGQANSVAASKMSSRLGIGH
ncbi:unnamed protein product [Rotaria magnacalcarata]|nr:unnamed protein product [Rotaria magnacalcarata]CAF3991447.1 unnamed protein product [Rotaria magnacalcarata]